MSCIVVSAITRSLVGMQFVTKRFDWWEIPGRWQTLGMGNDIPIENPVLPFFISSVSCHPSLVTVVCWQWGATFTFVYYSAVTQTLMGYGKITPLAVVPGFTVVLQVIATTRCR